jgi:hypothetical protein
MLSLKSMFKVYLKSIFVIASLIFFIIGCKKNENPLIEFDNYMNNPNLPLNGLIAYYPLNGNANDYSGNNNHAILNGTTTSTDRFGNSNKAFTLNGIDNNLEISNFPSLNQNSGSICLWVRTNSDFGPNSRVLLSKIDTYGAGYIIKALNKSTFWFESRISNGSNSGVDMGINPYADNTFFFIAITFNSISYNAYYEGHLTLSNSANPDWLFNENELPLLIGKSLHSGTLNFKGDIDDILIYNRQLSEEEIFNIYSWK